MVETDGSITEWLRLAVIALLGIVTYFVKRTFDKQDHMEKELQELKTLLAVLLSRDRKQRLEDYRRKTDFND